MRALCPLALLALVVGCNPEKPPVETPAPKETPSEPSESPIPVARVDIDAERPVTPVDAAAPTPTADPVMPADAAMAPAAGEALELDLSGFTGRTVKVAAGEGGIQPGHLRL